MQRKMLMFESEADAGAACPMWRDFEVDAGVDRASGIEVCNTMLITKEGAAWAVPAADKKDARRNRGDAEGISRLEGIGRDGVQPLAANCPTRCR